MEAPKKYGPIPKLIHALWIGPFKEPTEWIQSWRPFCQKFNWKFKLWREKDIDEFKLKNRKEYDESVSYQQKSDIARYEILFRFGGLWIDCDMVWLGNNLEKVLPLSANMFIGVFESASPSINKTIFSPYIANGFFIAPKNHNILKKCIELIPERVKMNSIHTFEKTGPVLLNLCIKEPIIILPDTYVFPLDFHKIHNVPDLSVFAKSSIIYTYNGFEYPHMKKLKMLKDTGKCTNTNGDCAKYF